MLIIFYFDFIYFEYYMSLHKILCNYTKIRVITQRYTKFCVITQKSV